jgi:hypothetical protein
VKEEVFFMAVNDALRFEDADQRVKRAFLREPERILLQPHAQLYRWTNRAVVEGRAPAWWSFVTSTRLPSGAVAEGFRVSEERAVRLSRPHREFARARAAISEQFDNSMRELLIVRLNAPVWAFVGQASGQPEFGDKRPEFDNVFLIGGAYQVWVPNLERQHVTVVPVDA